MLCLYRCRSRNCDPSLGIEALADPTSPPIVKARPPLQPSARARIIQIKDFGSLRSSPEVQGGLGEEVARMATRQSSPRQTVAIVGHRRGQVDPRGGRAIAGRWELFPYSVFVQARALVDSIFGCDPIPRGRHILSCSRIPRWGRRWAFSWRWLFSFLTRNIFSK